MGGAGLIANEYGMLNDLWKYDLVINQWTWMGGDSIISQSSVFGNMGEPLRVISQEQDKGPLVGLDLVVNYG